MKQLTPFRGFLLACSLLYTLGFGLYYISAENLEFLWYVLTLLVLIAFVALTIQRSQLSNLHLALLSLWGLLHMAGGSVVIDGDVLYRFVLVPFHVDGDFTVLKFDQLVHAYGFGVSALALLSIFERWTKETVGPRALAATAVLAAMGLGVLNEIVEFAAVVALAETGVGDYYNTALDLVFNTLGALIAVGLVFLVRRLKSRR